MNIINYLVEQKFNGLNDETEIRTKLYAKNIMVSYEKDVIDGKRRYIFTSTPYSRKQSNSPNKLCTEANGLVLEANENGWDLLVLPQTTPKININTSIANDLIRKQTYDIFYVEDGTIISLYFHKTSNKWAMSTQKGINVNDVVFNTLTYDQMFNEVLEKNGINSVEFYAGLDKQTCYTLGFKHNDIHPFMEGTGEPVYKIWFIQMVQIKEVFEECIICKTSPFEQISNHKKVEYPIKSLGVLFKTLKETFTTFVNVKTINYGYILVARDNNGIVDNAEYNILFLESNLMNYIRNLWYDAAYIKYSKYKSYDRISTILLNSFIDNNRVDIFNALFPQFKQQLDILNDVENTLVEKIYNKLNVKITILKNTNTNTDTDSNKVDDAIASVTKGITDMSVKSSDEVQKDDEESKDEKKDEIELSENDIVDILANQFSSQTSIHSHEKPKQEIRRVIHNTANIDYYYRFKDLQSQE